MRIQLRRQAEWIPPTNLLLRQKSSGRFRLGLVFTSIDSTNYLLPLVPELDFHSFYFIPCSAPNFHDSFYHREIWFGPAFNLFAVVERTAFNFVPRHDACLLESGAFWHRFAALKSSLFVSSTINILYSILQKFVEKL